MLDNNDEQMPLSLSWGTMPVKANMSYVAYGAATHVLGRCDKASAIKLKLNV